MRIKGIASTSDNIVLWNGVLGYTQDYTMLQINRSDGNRIDRGSGLMLD